jgi:hypothetical protein
MEEMNEETRIRALGQCRAHHSFVHYCNGNHTWGSAYVQAGSELIKQVFKVIVTPEIDAIAFFLRDKWLWGRAGVVRADRQSVQQQSIRGHARTKYALGHSERNHGNEESGAEGDTHVNDAGNVTPEMDVIAWPSMTSNLPGSKVPSTNHTLNFCQAAWSRQQTCRLSEKLGLEVDAHFKPDGNITPESDAIWFATTVPSKMIFSALRGRIKSAVCQPTRRRDTTADERGARARADTHVNDAGNLTPEMDVIAVSERSKVLRFPNPCVRMRVGEEAEGARSGTREKS